MTARPDPVDPRHHPEGGSLLPSPMRIVGTGLIGGSLGMALMAAGVDVVVEDASPAARSLAVELGVGRIPADHDDDPQLVIVAAPPDVAAQLVADALCRWPHALVTDVASVKSTILAGVQHELVGRGVDEETHLSRYVGAHPMAGREVSGVISARPDLFQARPFVVVPHERTAPRAISLLRLVASEIGAVVSVMGPTDHDAAVAAVSHVPQLIASLLAQTLLEPTDQALSLAGQGLRDTTRIAASDPRLWVEILGANAEAIRPVLEGIDARLQQTIGALASLEGSPDPTAGSRRALAEVIAEGNRGVARIPGKHGGPGEAFVAVPVLVPDSPGELGRLLTDVGDAGVNLEDLRMEHAMGSPYGIAHLSVHSGRESLLTWELRQRGWTVAGD